MMSLVGYVLWLWLSLVIYFLSQHMKKPLQKHAYSNISKILQPKKENFQIKKSDIFHILKT